MNSVDTLLNKFIRKRAIGENGRLFVVSATHLSRLVQNRKNSIATKATTPLFRGFLHYHTHQ